MNCIKCDVQYIKKNGYLRISDNNIGEYKVEKPVDYYECDKCGDLLFTIKTANLVEQARKNRLNEILQLKPLNNFLASTDAAIILGITRQAFHKNKRIKKGFIYQTQFGDKTVYLKKSVFLFKEKGDGRFQLQALIKEPFYERSNFVIIDSKYTMERLTYNFGVANNLRSVSNTNLANMQSWR